MRHVCTHVHPKTELWVPVLYIRFDKLSRMSVKYAIGEHPTRFFLIPCRHEYDEQVNV
jgi:hypothetical protein